jgi:hypothetical protein
MAHGGPHAGQKSAELAVLRSLREMCLAATLNRRSLITGSKGN